MILHVVLYRPRADLPAGTTHLFLEALTSARRSVPAIRHFWVGHRIAEGPTYQMSGFPDFPYAAVAAFDDRAGLEEYLRHPAHEALSRVFNGAAEQALIYDYEGVDPDAAQELSGTIG